MAKKKDKNQPITHIHNLNLEIDYDKLAESITKAQANANETTQKQKRYTLGTFATPLIVALRHVHFRLDFSYLAPDRSI